MDLSEKVYFDYAATTPIDKTVVDIMMPYFSIQFGNPSSIHAFGQVAESALERSRQEIAGCLNCSPSEIIFTGCGTESDNLACRGAARAARQKRKAKHLLTTPVEHHAVTHTLQQLAEFEGFELEFLPVDESGIVRPDDVSARIRKDTALVSIIFANNEIGSINPIAEIGAICRQRGVAFHTDAVQAAAHLAIDLGKIPVDLLSIGAHKFYGPKGVGALYVRKGTPILPVQTGGGQESGLRAGTQNIPYIVGMAEALQIVKKELAERQTRLQPLRDRLIGYILEEIPDSRLTGHPSQRLPNHASFVFKGVDGNALLAALDVAGFACSSGSACKTGSPTPSNVLTAIGLSAEWALGSLRVTLGKDTTTDHIDGFLGVLPGIIARLRQNR